MNRKKLTINDLEEETRQQMIDKIRQGKEMQKLLKKRDELMRAHRMADASRMTAMIKQVEQRSIQVFLDEYEGESVRCAELMKEMPPEDVTELNVYLNAIIFLSDALESFSMEVNNLLHRRHPDHNIEMYDTLVKLGKEANRQMKFMSEATNMIYQLQFAGEADKMQEHVLNKVRSFVRKVNKKEKDAAEKMAKKKIRQHDTAYAKAETSSPPK